MTLAISFFFCLSIADILKLVIRMIDYKSIGKRIAIYRKSIPMTQAALSEKLGVTESYVSQIECGSAKISLGRLAQISDILDVDIALLVSEKATVSDMPINTAIFEIIKNWPTEHMSLLTDLLICADTNLRKPNV